MPRGNSDWPFSIVNPEVATVVFSVTRPPSTNSISRSRGLPTAGRTTPVAPDGITWAATPIEASVIRVTSAVPLLTLVTLPARPPTSPASGSLAAASTGWSSFTPSLEPLSILMLEYQTVGERAITRAPTGSVPRGKPSSCFRPTSPLSCVASRCEVCASASAARRRSTSRFSSWFSFLAPKVSPAQPNRSRTGLSARLVPVSIGANASWAPRWSAWKNPPPDSPKYAVRIAIDRATNTASAARLLRTTFLSYTPGAPRAAGLPPSARSGILVAAVDRLELLEAAAGADRDTGERRLGQVRRHLGLVAQAVVEPLEERAAAGEHDAAVHDVRGQLRRRAVARLLDRIDDRLERLLQRHPDLLAREDDRFGQARDQVAPADLRLHLLGQREGGADLQLDLLSGLLPDHQLVLALDVVDDRLVELVPADADRLRHDDAAERDHRHLARAAADVDDHVPGGFSHGQPGADRGGHRLLDEVRLARARAEAGLLDGALLHPGHPRRHADDHARVRPAVLVHLLDEVAEHLLGHVEVGDHAVLERPDRLDRAGGPAQHALGLDPHRVDLGAARVDRHDGRLREHDAAPAHVDERVGGSKVDGHVATAHPGEIGEEAHGTRPQSRALPGPHLWVHKGRHEPQEGGHRQSHDVEPVALDFLDQHRAELLDRVAAGPVAPFAAPEVAVDVGLAELAEADPGDGDVRALLPVLSNRDPAHHLVPAVRKLAEPALGLGRVGRLAVGAAVPDDHAVGGQDPLAGHGAELAERVLDYQLARVALGQLRDVWGLDTEVDPELLEDRPPSRRARGQDELPSRAQGRTARSRGLPTPASRSRGRDSSGRRGRGRRGLSRAPPRADSLRR